MFQIVYTWSLNPEGKHSERIDQKRRERQWSSIARDWNFQSLSINLKIIILRYLLMYSVTKIWFILWISKDTHKRESAVNHLLISDDTKQHYCWIKVVSKLLYLQTPKHVWFRCLNTFNSKESLASHHEHCKSYESIQIELPEVRSKISFKNHNKLMRIPSIVHVDFESFTPLLSTCQSNPENSYTNQYQKHIPANFVTT